jgi:hypothetical protein
MKTNKCNNYSFSLLITSCSRPRVAVAQSDPVPSRPVPSRTIPYRTVSSHPFPSRPVPSRPISSHRITSCPVLYRPIMCYLVPPRPVPYIKKRAYWNVRLRQKFEAIGEELSEIKDFEQMNTYMCMYVHVQTPGSWNGTLCRIVEAIGEVSEIVRGSTASQPDIDTIRVCKHARTGMQRCVKVSNQSLK